MKYIPGILLLGAALFIMTMNWLCVIASNRNRKRGIDKHHSQVLLIPELLLGVAALLPLPFSKWYLLMSLALHVGTWCLPAGLYYFFKQLVAPKNQR